MEELNSSSEDSDSTLNRLNLIEFMSMSYALRLGILLVHKLFSQGLSGGTRVATARP